MISAPGRRPTLLTVLGARPQFVKASVVSRAVAEGGRLDEVVVHTGQHFDDNMSAVFFSDLEMEEPHRNLGISGGSHASMTGRMLVALEEVIRDERPDAVLVYGDTNSTLAAALAAAKLHVPVAHVEAGLRSFNRKMPEEINRILTDHASDWLFTPTRAARLRLEEEGIAPGAIHPVGDVMLDVALHHGARVAPDEGVLGDLALEPGGYVLATVHRAENTDDPDRLDVVLGALEGVAAELPVVWPVHPRTRQALEARGAWSRAAAVLTLLEPVGYLEMVRLEKYAALVATDSGGVQKEAFFHGVPCVTLREETEWVELVEGGWNRLAPPSDVRSVERTIRDALSSRGERIEPYGDGRAAERIVRTLEESLS